MKSKGNNNKPVLKVVTTKTLQPPKRYRSADVCLPAVTRPRHNSFEIILIVVGIFLTVTSAPSMQILLMEIYFYCSTLEDTHTILSTLTIKPLIFTILIFR
jgi:hypothetical protein